MIFLKKTEAPIKPYAVIEIGSTGIRMLVADVDKNKNRTVLDRAEIAVSLGMDVFTSGDISLDSQLHCISILSQFKEALASWALKPADAFVIATSAFREARNRDFVVDRILVKTGFVVKTIDGIEENRLMYLAVRDRLKSIPKKTMQRDSIIIETSGGSTELLLIRKGKIAGAHSFKLGTVRIERKLSRSADETQRYIEEFIRNIKGALETEMNLSNVREFIAVGTDAVIAAINIGKPISTWLWSIDLLAFNKFVDEIKLYSIDESMARFKISYNDAQNLHSSLLIYKFFLTMTQAKEIIVPETNIREGLLISKIDLPDPNVQKEFLEQISFSALTVLEKYCGDIPHANFIRTMSLRIYDVLEKVLPFEERSKLLLEVAAILHDIGMFIRMDNHNIHSAYIIQNSEIFGLSQYDRTIIAEIAKYHRGNAMPHDDEHFQLLSRSDRMLILKLTAIVRLADALDRGHAQKLSNATCKIENENFVIITKEKNISLEKIAVAEKGAMFELVFGYKLLLR